MIIENGNGKWKQPLLSLILSLLLSRYCTIGDHVLLLLTHPNGEKKFRRWT
jgi:hypothetical protein